MLTRKITLVELLRLPEPVPQKVEVLDAVALVHLAHGVAPHEHLAHGHGVLLAVGSNNHWSAFGQICLATLARLVNR